MKYNKYEYGNQIKYTIEKLSRKNIQYVKEFRCGNKEINNYLKNKAIDDDFGITYLIIDLQDKVAIGYYTLCCSGITFKYQNTVRTLPSIEIRYFAISRRLHRLQFDEEDEHYYFSSYIMDRLMQKCSEISENVLAAKYIILYSVKRAVNFYLRSGFEDFTEYFEPDQYRYIDGCKPMFIELP